MKRITTGIVATLALSLALVGCGKDKAKDDKQGEPAAAGKTAEGGKAAGGEGKSAPSSTSFAVFPADSEFVMQLSLDALRTSPMWATIAPMVQAKIDEEMKDVKATCGMDPIAKLSSVHFGGKPNDEKSMVIVVKGFTKSEISTCGAAMAKKEGKTVEITEEDGLTHFKGDGKDMYMAFIDDTTAVMSPNPDKAYVKARAAGTGGLDTNAAFMELLKNVDSSATVWFAALPTPGGEMDMSKNLPGAKGMFGSFKVTDGLLIDAGMRFDTPDNAKNAQNMATMGLQQAKGMMPPAIQSVVDKTKISLANNDLIIALALTKADIDGITAALGPMLGGMMMGAGAAPAPAPAAAP
jgi:hypothetical protein